MDEISTAGPTTVFQVEEGRVQKGQWTPYDFGVAQAEIEELAGGDPAANARVITDVLSGINGPARDVVLVNAAAALLIAGRAHDIKSGVALAAESIDSGAASNKLALLAEFTAQFRPVPLDA
jgi:anthranilate phosphoribosyltransferase